MAAEPNADQSESDEEDDKEEAKEGETAAQPQAAAAAAPQQQQQPQYFYMPNAQGQMTLMKSISPNATSPGNQSADAASKPDSKSDLELSGYKYIQ